jgi:hypothetical protein
VDEDASRLVGEAQSEKQARIRALHNETQESIHRPDHLAISLFEVRNVADRGMEAGAATSQLPLTAAAQDLGRVATQYLPDRSADEFTIITPRGSTLSIGADSPDRFLHQPSVESLWEDEGATHTEISLEQEERFERLSVQLVGYGAGRRWSRSRVCIAGRTAYTGLQGALWILVSNGPRSAWRRYDEAIRNGKTCLA